MLICVEGMQLQDGVMYTCYLPDNFPGGSSMNSADISNIFSSSSPAR